METVILPKGAIIHFNGMPFELQSDVEMGGLQVNLDLALAYDTAPKTGLESSQKDA